MTRKQTIYIVALFGTALLLGACAGFDAGDLISVRTPQAVQEQTGLTDKLTLNEAENEYRAYVETFRRNAAQWKTDIERADHIRGVVSQFTLGALESVGPAIGGIPVLGPALPLLTGLAGLFLRRPGDANKDELRKQKEASYKAGQEAAKKLLGQA